MSVGGCRSAVLHGVWALFIKHMLGGTARSDITRQTGLSMETGTRSWELNWYCFD
jgi:hypothetical protein